MGKKYNLTSTYMFCQFDNFKLKQSQIFIETVKASRINDSIRFSCYGNIYFEDETSFKHEFPIVEELDAFNRNKTNCLIFDIIDDRINNMYDKLFVYVTNFPKNSTRGLYLLNTKTNHANHLCELPDLDDEYIIDISKTINIYANSPVMKYLHNN